MSEKANPSITVLIATRDRAAILRESLEAMCRVRRDTLSVELVVVDNGSTDDTRAVLEEFSRRLPLRHLSDPVPGKSHAINHALRNVKLGDIIVFTDDDISPEPSWLSEIADVCERWPDHAVFGGRIDPVWPCDHSPPNWANQDVIQSLAFARHHVADAECEYPPDKDPFGGNFWVRRDSVKGVAFLEAIGAHPTQQKLGDETHFVRQLRRRGIIPIYAPRARVEHRIESGRTSKRAIYRRALQGGLGVVYVHGLPEKQLFQRSRSLWTLKRLQVILKIIFEFPLVAVSRDESWRVLNATYLFWSIAEHAQALRLSFVADAALMHWISDCPECE